jgi:hypothetical protein
LWPLFLQSPVWNKQLWSWHHSSIILSFQAMWTTLTWTKTQDNYFRSFDLS